jgi:maltose alpha-D-glucosyltransferase/alpha-amylase
VLNHTSDQHPWFVESRSSKDNPKRDYYLWRKDATGFAGATNAFPDIKAQNWMADPETGEFYFATFYPQQPDLNWDNEQVFEGMLANMEFWAERGVDGFRLDAAAHFIKREGTTSQGLPETHQLIKRIRHRLEQKYPDAVLLAETAENIESSKLYFGDGDECHLVYNFPLMAHLWLALSDGMRSPLEALVSLSADIPANCAWATFLRSHDEINLGNLSPEERHQLIDFLDPKHAYHFNKGEATSMRVANVFQGDTNRIRDAFELLYHTPGTPIMYYGDEIGMQNLPPVPDDLDSRHAVRGAFDWSAAEHQAKDPDSLLNRTARIIRKR